LKTVTEGFVACCEEGNFGQMKKGRGQKATGKPQMRKSVANWKRKI
jgi:hypothetical protein